MVQDVSSSASNNDRGSVDPLRQPLLSDEASFKEAAPPNAEQAVEPAPKNGVIATARAALRVRSWKNLGLKGGLIIGGVATLTGGALIVAGTLTVDPLMVLIGTITAIAGAALFLITLLAAAAIACKNRRARRRAEAAEPLVQPERTPEQPSPNMRPPTETNPLGSSFSNTATTGAHPLPITDAATLLQDDEENDALFNPTSRTQIDLPSDAASTPHLPRSITTTCFQDDNNSDNPFDSRPTSQTNLTFDQPIVASHQTPTPTSSSSQEGGSLQTPEAVVDSLPPDHSSEDVTAVGPTPQKITPQISQTTNDILDTAFVDLDRILNGEPEAKLLDSNQNLGSSLSSSPSSSELAQTEVVQPNTKNVSLPRPPLLDPTDSDLEEFQKDANADISDFYEEGRSPTNEIYSLANDVFSGDESDDLSGRVKQGSHSNQNLTAVFNKSTISGVSEEEFKTAHSIPAYEIPAPPSPAVKAEVYKVFNNLMLINKEASGDLSSEASKHKLIAYKETLPEAMQKEMGARDSWTKANLEKFVKDTLGLSDSIDLGGHGGTMTAKVTLDNQTYFLFLKPLDAVESRNYKVMNHFSPEVSKYMPSIYGEISINNKNYMMMENTRMDAHGNPLKQLVDPTFRGSPAARRIFSNQQIKKHFF